MSMTLSRLGYFVTKILQMLGNSVLEEWLSAHCGLVGRSLSHNVHLFSQQSNSASRVRGLGRSVS